MPSVKQLRKSLVAHNNKCKVKGVRKMKKAQLLTANRKVYGKQERKFQKAFKKKVRKPKKTRRKLHFRAHDEPGLEEFAKQRIHIRSKL